MFIRIKIMNEQLSWRGGTYSMMKEFSKKRKQKPEEQPMIVDSGEESDDNMADLDELDMKA